MPWRPQQAEPFSEIGLALERGDFDAADIMLHNLHESAALDCFKVYKHVLLELSDS